MGLSQLQTTMLALEMESLVNSDDGIPEEVEIYADSLQEALKIASDTILAPIGELEYEIHQRGSSGFFGMARTPYKITIRKSKELTDKWSSELEDLNVSLENGKKFNEFGEEVEPDVDGRSIIRIYSTGVFIKVIPPKGQGQPESLERASEYIHKAGIFELDKHAVEKAIKQSTGEPVKIASFKPRDGADSSMTIDIAPDEMEATVLVSAPRPGGRHLMVKDVVNALKKSGVVYGFQNEGIEEALDNDKYGVSFVAATGDPVVNGKDGFVDYKVRIEKKIEFKEDESGRIDFLAKDLIENVVQGQVLAELIEPEKGQNGQTIFNKILPAKDGHPTEMKPGKGTILSEDGRQVLAEKNGQVVYIAQRINVEENYVIGGDVGLDTGNIMFLGSVTVRGSVSDNMEVKAAGNIEVAGSVQKAHMEAEGDIIVRQGIQGRDGAVIESTTGSAYAKFIQNTELHVEKDVIVQEGVLHSKIHAGSKVICNGKRAQIVGGEIMAGEEVRVKQLGAQASTPTLVTVGTNPKILAQIQQLETIKLQAREKLDKIEQNIRTLTTQKSAAGEGFAQSKEEMLQKMIGAQEKLTERLKEAESEILQLTEYMTMLASSGKVHVEKTMFPGVKIIINGAEFNVNDEYNHVTLT
ncbi:MAG: FapA family protein, partial [Leptospirales bacterium]